MTNIFSKLITSTIFVLLFFSLGAHGQNELGEINLGTTVEGNRELPKILYIIPWATPPGPGQVDPLVPHSANVFERTFSPVERIELQRQLRYFDEDYDRYATKPEVK